MTGLGKLLGNQGKFSTFSVLSVSWLLSGEESSHLWHVGFNSSSMLMTKSKEYISP